MSLWHHRGKIIVLTNQSAESLWISTNRSAPPCLGVRSVEQSRARDNARVVHQDGDVAHGRLGLLGSVVDIVPCKDRVQRFSQIERGLLGGHVHGVGVGLISLRLNHGNRLFIANLLKMIYD